MRCTECRRAILASSIPVPVRKICRDSVFPLGQWDAMPLPLTDPRWSELEGSYGGTVDVVAWLKDLYKDGSLISERLGDLINEVEHQGDSTTAMYAVAPHLMELARRACPDDALHLLTHAGLIHANAGSPGAVPCPAFLSEDFMASASEGAKMISPLLPLATAFDDYKWAVAALAGFLGHHSFTRFLDGLDLYDGQWHHHLLNGTFPSEE